MVVLKYTNFSILWDDQNEAENNITICDTEFRVACIILLFEDWLL